MKITDHIEVTCENNLELMCRCSDNQFDLALADPPYFNGPQNLGYFGNYYSSIGVKREAYNMIENWDVPGYDFYNELCRVSKHQIIWGINYFEFAGETPGRIIWDKLNGTNTFSDAEIASCSMHESIRMFKFLWNGMIQGKNFREGDVMQGNKKKNEKRIHATQKPVALYKWILEKYCEPGFKILDTHFGSGSSGIACHDFGYDLTACDIDVQCFNSAVNRLKEHTRQLRINYG